MFTKIRLVLKMIIYNWHVDEFFTIFLKFIPDCCTGD